MSENENKADDDANSNDDSEWIGPMPSEASKPKRRKGISIYDLLFTCLNFN